jgi:hypothetical protein
MDHWPPPRDPGHSAKQSDSDMIREVSGSNVIAAIRQAARAIVLVGVPWSDEEREARKISVAAAGVLESTKSELAIAFFRLDVHEDKIGRRWIEEQGYSQFIEMGAGSLLLTESGRVVFTELSAITLGVDGVVSRSVLLWFPNKTEAPTTTKWQRLIQKAATIRDVCIDAADAENNGVRTSPDPFVFRASC